MALQSSGQIKLSEINTELGRASNANISLNAAEDGAIVAINKCSLKRPLAPNPAAISEWYSYNHTATCPACWTGTNEVSYSFSFGSGGSQTFATVINLTTQGHFRPKFWFSGLTNGSVNMTYSVFQLDSNKNNPVFLGNYTSTYGQAIYDDPYIGTTYTSGFVYILCQLSGASGGANSGTFKVSVTCPVIQTCGASVSVSTADCFCSNLFGFPSGVDFSGSYTPYGVSAWFDAGTTSRTITLTYTAISPGAGSTLSLTIKNGAGTTIVNNASVSFGSSQTYSFTYTYSTNQYLYVRFDTSCWC
jgi:hypothetical protein